MSTNRAVSQSGENRSFEVVDPQWHQMRQEAAEVAAREPALASFVFATVLNHDKMEDVLSHRLAQRLNHLDVDAGLLRQTFDEILAQDESICRAFRADLAAVFERDPACNRLIEPLLYFKGFQALQTHRMAHHLWNTGRQDFALYLQSQSSRTFGTDIHPAAKIGSGIMIDHATGVVIGETAVIGDNCSLLHGVTLGGSGKESGDRHPKLGQHVLVGAGAKILGNIKIGNCSRIAAGSVVLKDVAEMTTVAGVPAKVISKVTCKSPSQEMDHMLASAKSEEKDDNGP